MQAKLLALSLPLFSYLRCGGPEGIGCTFRTLDYQSVSSSLFHRTWALILGMTGLIILFWFVADSVALRYFVSMVSFHRTSPPILLCRSCSLVSCRTCTFFGMSLVSAGQYYLPADIDDQQTIPLPVR